MVDVSLIAISQTLHDDFVEEIDKKYGKHHKGKIKSETENAIKKHIKTMKNGQGEN